MASTTFTTRALTAALFTLLAWAATPFTTQAQLPDYLPTEGLVGWWPFNGNANDESGNGNNGTVNGATLTEDRFGNANAAYFFSGSGCSTRIDANVNTSSINGEMTLSIWVLRSGAGCIGPRYFEAWPGSNSVSHFALGWDNSIGYPQGVTHRVAVNPNGNDFGPTGLGTGSFSSVANNTWTHIIYSNDGLNAFLWQDGMLRSTGTNPPGSVIQLASDIAIGRMNHPAYDALDGKIDDIGIWNRALTPEEVTALYTGEPVVTDCQDPEACNFEAVDEECVYPEPNLDCAGNCLNDADGDGVCDENEVAGCTDTTACNYMIEATEEDGSCLMPPVLDLPESITICEGESILLDAGAGFDSYLWSTGDTTQTLEVSEAGNYTVEVGDFYDLSANGNLPAYLPADGLVGWWPFNGNANDESGNGNDGVVNGATLTEDRDGNPNAAYNFDGVDDYIEIQLNQSLSYTYSAWVNFNNFTELYQTVLQHKDNCVRGGGPLFGVTNDQLRLVVENCGQCSVSSCPTSVNATNLYQVNPNQWYNMVLTASQVSNDFVVYVNGQQVYSFNSPVSIQQYGVQPLTLGKWHDGVNLFYTNASKDDIGFWNRALSADEVEQLYTTQTNALCTSAVSIEVIVQVKGCTDEVACNYNPEAVCDDGSCTYPSEPFLDCDGNCLNDANNNGICDELDVPGCTFEGACNFNPEATVNDNSCFFATAVFDCNGNCQQDANNNGICDQLEAIGAQLCGEGTVWDNSVGTCIGFDPCPADLNDSGVVDVADMLIFLTFFGENCD